ncbi:SCF ubiquitin ligase complex subunit cdc4 [Thoreauomyces humboldtii]|nr:SCF ubiquitin ligase complex subunit cdc4 [Thoreauomyces humboldtii]
MQPASVTPPTRHQHQSQRPSLALIDLPAAAAAVAAAAVAQSDPVTSSAQTRGTISSSVPSSDTSAPYFALAPRQTTTTFVKTVTTTEFPPLCIPQIPRRSRFDHQVYPLSNTPTPPALQKFTFDVDGVSTSVAELEVDADTHRYLTAQHQRTSAANRTLGSVDIVDSPLRNLSRKRPISPDMTGAFESRDSNPTAFVLASSAPGCRPPKRRGSIGSSAARNSATDDLHRITSRKPHLAGGPIPIPLTPFPEANPMDIPSAVQNNEAAVNLPSPTASPTTQTSFPTHLFDESPLPINRHVGSYPNDLPPPSALERASIDIPPEFAEVTALGDISHILNTFDTLPTQLKSYLLLQLLRRCPFSTLQFVSSLILPSLKRDFLGLLPVELAYHVLQFLDIRSLGRCASVSKTWRHVVDGDGAEVAVWKKRLQSEDWYDDSEVHEQVMSAASLNSQDVMGNPRSTSLSSLDDDDQPRPLNGKQVREHWPLDWNGYGSLLHDHRRPTESFSEGLEVPPNLFKGLYRRHHLVRQNWFHGRYKHISFPGHAFNVVTCLQFDADKIVSGSDDQTMNIYDTATGTLRKRLEGHDGGVWALQYWNNVLVSGSTDRTVRVWDMEAGECTHLFEGHTSTVRCLIIIIPYKNHVTGRMEPDVPLIVTGSRDATLRVWRLPHPKRDQPWKPAASGASTPNDEDSSSTSSPARNPFFRHVLTGHNNSVRAIAGYGNTLVSGSYDSTVRIWDLKSGTVVHTCRGHREKVYSVGYSHELERAVSGSMDAFVKIWCTRTGTCLYDLEGESGCRTSFSSSMHWGTHYGHYGPLLGHTSLVGLLELTPQYLVSAAADATLRVWSPTTGQCLANLKGHPAAITCFHHDPKLNRIVSGSEGGVKVWELSSTGYGSGQPPAGAPFAPSLAYTQGPTGPQPVHGRFVRDLVGGVQGVWRTRMDEQRLVCAVQRDGGRTWFEVLDFTDGNEHGVRVEGTGDRAGTTDGDEDEEDDDDEDGDDADDDDGDDDDGADGSAVVATEGEEEDNVGDQTVGGSKAGDSFRVAGIGG